jgi:DNA-binding NarL/FixJ family response regulator
MSARTTPTMAPSKHRILLVDDHAIVREGFAEIINAHAGLEVCGEAATAPEAIAAVARLTPDLVVVDLTLQGGSGLDLIKNLKAIHPLLPMVVLSMHDETLYAERALRAGALGYVMKREDSSVVLEAIQSALRGQLFLSKVMRERMLHKMVGGAPPAEASNLAHLSDRELEVFQLLGEGRTTSQIARKLHLSVSTVETHRAHLKEKLNLTNGAELMRAAVEWVNSH